MDDCPLGPGVDGGGWKETPGSGGGDGGEGRSILGRETPGCGGAGGGEWEGDRCGEFCNRIRFFSHNRAALSCLHRLLDHGFASSVGHGSLDEAVQQGKRRNSLLSHLRERKMTPAIAHTCPVSMRIDEHVTCFHGNARKCFNLIGQSHPVFNPDGTKYIRCLKCRPMTKKIALSISRNQVI